jgi:hypothetical protein
MVINPAEFLRYGVEDLSEVQSVHLWSLNLGQDWEVDRDWGRGKKS